MVLDQVESSGEEGEERRLRVRSAQKRLSGCPDRLDERLHPEDGDYPLQNVGENVTAYLRPDLLKGAQAEAGQAHPR